MYSAKRNKTEGSGGRSWIGFLERLGGAACLILFAPLILTIFLLLRAEGGPAFVRRRHAEPDGTGAALWRFRAGRSEPLGRFLAWSRTEVLPECYNVARGDIGFSRMLDDLRDDP
jgi:lipopolysaccharide/colanic/teichoic acid biosynthesis glycosyltransferase